MSKSSPEYAAITEERHFFRRFRDAPSDPAFKEGYKAALLGEPEDKNPYGTFRESFEAGEYSERHGSCLLWLKGWRMQNEVRMIEASLG